MLVDRIDVKIRLVTDMLGTVPYDKNIYTNYIESKKPDEYKEEREVEYVLEQINNRGYTGFMKDENGLFIYNYLVRGFIRHAGDVLKYNLNIKCLKSKITDTIFVEPRKLYLHKTEPDDVIERPLRGQVGMQQITTVIRSDCIKTGTPIEFSLIVIRHKEITVEKIKDILSYGRLQGLGQFRNGGYGQFKVLSFEVFKESISLDDLSEQEEPEGLVITN